MLQVSVGDVVEVEGQAKDGFQNSFCTAKVVQLMSEGAARVQYEEFVSEDGAPLLETFDLKSPRLRPSAPRESRLYSLQQCKVGYPVEVFDRDCWWKGVITNVKSNKVEVHCLADGEIQVVKYPRNIRLAYDWSGSVWLPGYISKPILSQLGLPSLVAPPLIKSPGKGSPAKPSPAGSSDRENQGGNNTDLRRSHREVKNRIVWVKNVPVLKDNFYDLEAGEPSVYDKELSRDAAFWQQQGVQMTRPKSPPRVRVERPVQPRAVEVTHRMEHNSRMRLIGQKLEPIRAHYLQQHLKQLEPFTTAAARASISAKAANLPPGWQPPPPPTVQPQSITAIMREYQVEGLSFLVSKHNNAINPILADEMGLGKTLQTISLLAYLKYERNVPGPHLVVVPLSVISSWLAEFKKWCPSLRVVRLHCSDKNEVLRLRKEVLGHPESFDVAVTTYDMIRSDNLGHALQHSIVWYYVVLDEGHKVKNEETLISNAMRNVSRVHTLMLTGTPVQNNMHELFALLTFMYPDVFTDPQLFDSAFDLTHCQVDDKRLEAAHYLLRPFLLRRLKSEVEVSLPPLVETRIGCPLSEMQTFWYRRLLLRNTTTLKNLEAEATTGGVRFNEESNDWKKMMNLLMQLRKVCNHPYMFADAEPDFDGSNTGEDIVDASGKLQVLDSMLAKLKARGHRVVLFSQLNMTLDIIEDFLLMRGYTYRRLDGSTNRIKRMIDIEQFNKPGSDIFVYILNTRAGGLGVNLQTADTAILFDSDWNPQWDLQAMARVHRIGQKKPVAILRLCTEGTVEERVQQRAEKKLYLDQMVNRGSTAQAEELEKLTTSELLSMLAFGADRIFRNDRGVPPSSEELDTILDRCRTPRQTAPGAGVKQEEDDMMEDGRHCAASFSAEAAPLSTSILQGVDYSEMRQAKAKDDGLAGIAAEYWNEDRKRKRQQAGTSAPAGPLPEPKRRQVQQAGVHYGHMDVCQVCWDGGDLMCCDYCPCSFHPECLGLTNREVQAMGGKKWACPHHSCATCQRSTNSAGGLLFRCQMCHQAFCEDHVPVDYEMLGECEHFQALGQRHPTQAAFIHCSHDCAGHRKLQEPVLRELIEHHADTPWEPTGYDPVVLKPKKVAPPKKGKKAAAPKTKGKAGRGA